MEYQQNCADDCEHGPETGSPRGSKSNPFADGNVGTWTPKFYICPSAGKIPLEETLSYGWDEGKANSTHQGHDQYLSKGNYAACWGSDTYMSFEDENTAGAFGVVMLNKWKKKVPVQSENQASMKGAWKMGHKWGTRENRVRDGMSNTMAVSEVIGYRSIYDARGTWMLNSMGSTVFTAHTGPNADGSYEGSPVHHSRDQENYDHIPFCYSSSDDGAGIPQDDPLYCVDKTGTQRGDVGKTWAAARSYHSGGVNVLMCDGSVRFVNNSIALEVWRAMATRAASDVVSSP